MTPVEPPVTGSEALGRIAGSFSHVAYLDRLIRSHEARARRAKKARRLFAAAGVASAAATILGAGFALAYGGHRDTLLIVLSLASLTLVVNGFGLSLWLTQTDLVSADTLRRLDALRLRASLSGADEAKREITEGLERLILERPGLSLNLSGDPTTDPNG